MSDEFGATVVPVFPHETLWAEGALVHHGRHHETGDEVGFGGGEMSPVSEGVFTLRAGCPAESMTFLVNRREPREAPTSRSETARCRP